MKCRRNQSLSSPKLSGVAALVLMTFATAMQARASEASGAVEFDTTFLRVDSGSDFDARRFSRGNMVSPGIYSVDIIVNGNRVKRDEVRFVTAREGENATPCLTRMMLESAGFDFSGLTTERGQDSGEALADACIDLRALVPEASIDFDFSEQKLVLSIPQRYMRASARGYVSPEFWDRGVNAGFLSYNANTYRTRAGGEQSTQNYLGLNAGVNVGGWYFRHQSSLTASTGQATQFDNIATFVQHDITRMRAQAVIGDAQTTGDVFDSVAFRGVQIATDDRMLPESLRGFAPVVRGTADSNALVTVRQNGLIIYETSVTPGPFEIRDLYATGSGGNLDVTVTEADGRARRFTVPYASVAQSLRPGTTRFAVTAGQLRDDSLFTKPAFAQFTLQRGLTNLVTLYGGAIASEGYAAVNVGAALNTKYGAFASDITAARTQIPGKQAMQGKSLHIGYAKFVDPTGTNLSLGAYRYSDSSYLSFADAARLRDAARDGGNPADRNRGRVQLTIDQRLGKHGSVFATASSQSYWNRPGNDIFYQAGYSNRFKYGTYSVTAGRTQNSDGTMSNQFMVSTTIPLGRSQHAPQLTTNLNMNGGATNIQANVGGTAGERNQYSYNAYGSMAQLPGASMSSNVGVSGAWRASHAQVSASASGGAGSSQVSAGVSGSIVAHPGGVTFSQTVGDTFGIVEAKGAEGAGVSGATGVKIDSHGYAVVPYLTPYSMNNVDVDPRGSSLDTELQSTSEQVAPRSGSIVMLRYKTVTGRAALIRAPRLAGDALPFGAEVSDGAGHVVGVVAQDSRIFARGIEDKSTLVVKWGDRANEQCSIAYALPEKSDKAMAGYASVESHCIASHTRVAAGETTDSDAGSQNGGSWQ